jgi:hypothetical protein
VCTPEIVDCSLSAVADQAVERPGHSGGELRIGRQFAAEDLFDAKERRAEPFGVEPGVIGAVATMALGAVRLVLRASGTDDPVDQDPDDIRDLACELTEPDRVCRPAEPPRLPDPGGGGGGGFGALNLLTLLLWLLIFAAVAGLLFLLVRAVLQRSGWGRRATDTSTDEADDADEAEPISPVVVDRSREPVNWRAEAEQHRRAGRFRDALRCRYRALVGDLARSGLVDEIPGRTTGEERAQLRRVRPAANAPFSAAADLFDGAWYGHLPVDEADDDAFQRLEGDVLAEARR